MADDTAPQDSTDSTTDGPAETPATAATDEWQDKYKGQQKVNRDLERKLRETQAEIDKVRTANLSEAEKAVKEAEARGRNEATATFGQRLASAEFVAAAARRNPAFDASAVLDDLNLAKYVTDAGDPDTAGIAAAVERLIPTADRNPRPVGDADLGPRTPGRSESTPGLGRLRDAYASTSKTP